MRAMRAAVAWALLSSATIGSSLFASQEAEACSCMPPGTPTDELSRADAVFEGRVASVEAPVGPVGPGTPVFALEVLKVYKGSPGPRARVFTSGSSAACGFPFQPDETYLVYAYAAASGPAPLTTGLCSRTRLLARASEDVAALAAASPPAQPPQSPRAGCAGCAASPPAPPSLAALVLLVAVAALRARGWARRAGGT